MGCPLDCSVMKGIAYKFGRSGYARKLNGLAWQERKGKSPFYLLRSEKERKLNVPGKRCRLNTQLGKERLCSL